MKKPLGQIKFFDAIKGFGIIEQYNGGPELTVNATDVMNGDILHETSRVTYEITPSDKGHYAVKVTLAMERGTITNEDLKAVLENHKKWLSDKSKGKKANLSDLDLQGVDLSNANLSNAIMQNVDLSFSTLADANLAAVKLVGSDIVRATLNGVNLNKANLSHTDLRESKIFQGEKNDKGNSKLASLDEAIFYRANLSRVKFNKASIIKGNFTDAILNSTLFDDVILIRASFKNSNLENARFTNTDLLETDFSDAGLINSKFENSNITGIKYNESWHQKEYSKFKGLRIENSYGSPVFKRFAQDQGYLFEYMNKHSNLFKLWYYSSMCGRSMTRWITLSFSIALFFGLIYANYLTLNGLPSFDFNIGALNGQATWFTPYYFSFVTFTTLGFGDITPKGDLAGEIWVTIEVMLGYIMLGGLISIFSNKIAQRS